MTTWVQMNIQEAWFDLNGDPLSGGVLKAYAAGTTTPISIAITSAGGSPQASITLNALGTYEVSGNKVLPYIDRTNKWGIFANATDAAANTPFLYGPYDNVPIQGSAESDKIDRLTQTNYTTLIAAHAATAYAAGDIVTITDSGIAGTGTIVVSAGHGKTSLVGVEVVLDVNTYWRRNYSGGVFVEWFGGVGDASTINDTAFNAAVTTGQLVLAGAGSFYFSSGYAFSIGLAGFVGLGPEETRLFFNTSHGVQVSSNLGLDRRAGRLENFSINSISTSCDNKYAIYIPGVAASAAAVYNSGLNINNIEIGRNGRFGGGIYAKDIFRLNVSNIGMTDVSWMIRIVGSVVQAKFRNITSNNDSAASSINKYGISTEGATYNTGTLTPENIRFIDCSYIRGSRGINHTAGLAIEFCNFDTEADDYGALINAACEMKGGVIAPGTGATAWVGISRGVAIADADDATIFDGVDINCLRAPGTPASSYGIDAGDGVSPVRGLSVKNCRIRGLAGSLEQAFRGRICNDVTFEDNFIRTSTVTGINDVSCTGEHMHFSNNKNAGGVWSISDAGSSTAYGVVDKNNITTLSRTFTTRSQWQCNTNGAIISYKRAVGVSIADGGTIAHGLSSAPSSFLVSGRVAGEIVTVTNSDATNLTVAIKTHAGAAGTTQNVDYEAFF